LKLINLQNYTANSNEILQSDKDHHTICEWSKAGVKQIQDGGRPPFKKIKIDISPQLFKLSQKLVE